MGVVGKATGNRPEYGFKYPLFKHLCEKAAWSLTETSDSNLLY